MREKYVGLTTLRNLLSKNNDESIEDYLRLRISKNMQVFQHYKTCLVEIMRSPLKTIRNRLFLTQTLHVNKAEINCGVWN